MGVGNDQVIARGGTSLLIYGYYQGAKRCSITRDIHYLKRVANLTQY